MDLKDKVEKYQCHKHTFTCAKKKKTMTINENEGQGRLDGQINGPELKNISICRFKFPKFPLDETKLILGISKDTDEAIIKTRKKDLNKIINFLVRQTYCENPRKNDETWGRLKNLNFWEFLAEVGMFVDQKDIEKYTDQENKVRN